MSIISRPGSPVWNYDFELNGQRYRGPTEFALDYPRDPKKKGPNAKLARDAESAKKVELRKQTAQGISTAGNKVTISAAFDEFFADEKKERLRAAEKRARRDARINDPRRTKKVVANLKSLKRYLDAMLEFFTKVHTPRITLMSQINGAAMKELIKWRQDQARWDRDGEHQVSNATVNRTTTAVLRAVFSWLDDSKSLQFPGKPKWKLYWLKEAEERVRELLADEEAAFVEVSDPDYDLWRQFALRTGLRMENTLPVWPEVKLTEGRIMVIGKGEKDIDLPLSPEALAILKSRKGHHPLYVFTFVSKRTYGYTDKNTGIRHEFIQGQRYPITYWGAQTYWRRTRLRASIIAPSILPKDVRQTFTFHSNRHSFATRVLRTEKNLKLVKQLLVHSSILTTNKYAHVMDKELAAGVANSEQQYPTPERKAVA